MLCWSKDTSLNVCNLFFFLSPVSSETLQKPLATSSAEFIRLQFYLKVLKSCKSSGSLHLYTYSRGGHWTRFTLMNTVSSISTRFSTWVSISGIIMPHLDCRASVLDESYRFYVCCDLSLFFFAAPQQQVIVQDSKILQHMSATGMVSKTSTHHLNRFRLQTLNRKTGPAVYLSNKK